MDEKRQLQINRLQENLAPLRKIAGWTAKDLAERLDVTPQTISNLESKRTKMTWVQYLAIQHLFDQAIKDGTNNQNVLKESVEILRDGRGKLSEEEYQKASKAIKDISISAAGGVDHDTLALIANALLGVIAVAAGVAVAAASFPDE